MNVALFTTKHLLQSRRVYEGDIINLRIDDLQLADGKATSREVVEHNGGVVIACQPSEHEVVLIKQYRYSVDLELIELPAGRIEKSEPPLAAAQRELTEETGYKAAVWEETAKLFSAPGFCNEILYLYRATKAEFVGKSLDEDEETEVIVLPLEKAWELVQSQAISDAKTVAGLGMLLTRPVLKK
jgi:ADP-ribose pyrophosphatase